MRAKGSFMLDRVLRTAAVVVTAALAAATAAPARSADWPMYRNGPQRLNHSAEAFTPPLSLVWKFTTEASRRRVPPVIAGDRVFVAAGSTVYGLDLATGAQLWRYDAGSTVLGAPSYAEGKVFLGADNGKVIALSAADGTEAWAVAMARFVRAAPVVADGVVYAASLDQRVTAIDAETGAQRWTVRLTDEVWGAPAVQGDLLVVTTADAQVFGLDTDDGRTRIRFTVPRRRALMHSAVVTDDAIYVAGRAELRALSLRGTQRWALDVSSFVAGAPAFADGRLYLALVDGRVLAVDTQKGAVLWTFDFHTPMSAAPTVVGDVVIMGAVGGTVYAVDAATGTPRWRYLARPPGLAAGVDAAFDLVAPAVFANGSLYVVWDDGTLARFDTQGSDPAPPTIAMLTPADSQVTGVSVPKTIGAQVFDEESGLDLASLEMTLDGAKVEADYDPYTGYFTHGVGEDAGAVALPSGWHVVTVSARDQRGNVASRLWRFEAVPGGEATEIAPSFYQPALTTPGALPQAPGSTPYSPTYAPFGAASPSAGPTPPLPAYRLMR
ncbi:MAG TPA: PQQ-binding-like beta-propeller repeat protein [Armatimonadota bacterium]|nr:PQQ-binding-like beta-propeller repeat protein [Armatimonadota bacterium]